MAHHSLIVYSKFRYEGICQAVANYHPSFVAYTLLSCSYWMNIDYIKTFKHFLRSYFYAVIDGLIASFSITFLWSIILQNRLPMPFTGIIQGVMFSALVSIILWYRFPLHWRKSEHFRKRFKFYILSIATRISIFLAYGIYAKFFISAPQKYQWILALLLPLAREFNVWILSKVSYKASDAKDSSISISCSHNVNTKHCVFLCVMLGTVATDATSWIILGIDFMINICICLKIIWIRKKNCYDEKKENEMVSSLITLVMNELVEVVVPSTYLICFIMAYYGPNGDLIGNVRNGYWNYTPVSDIEHYIGNLLKFLFVDSMSLVISALLLWRVCRINIIRAYMHLQKEFWLTLAVTTAFNVNMVSCKMQIYFVMKSITNELV